MAALLGRRPVHVGALVEVLGGTRPPIVLESPWYFLFGVTV